MVYACIPPAAPTHHQDVDISPIPGPGKIIIYPPLPTVRVVYQDCLMLQPEMKI